MITFFNWLLVFNVFAGGFVFPSGMFEFYIGYIFIIFFLAWYVARYRDFGINLFFLFVLIAASLVAVFNVYFGNNTILLASKQIVGILIMGTAYYLLIKANDFDTDRLFKIYLRLALAVAVIGIVQEASYLLKFRYGYDYSLVIVKWGFTTTTMGILRVNSIFMEPSHFAVTMAPAFFVALLNIFNKRFGYGCARWGSMIIIISYILTLSAVAYIAVILSCLLLFAPQIKKFRYWLLFCVLSVGLVYTLYIHNVEIRMRVDDTIGVANHSLKASDSHLSVYALASNAFVAYHAFLSDPLFGHGLGSHPVSYDKYVRMGADQGFWQKKYPVVNRRDAGSLFLRLISETGLLGVVLFFYFLFKFYLKISYAHTRSVMNNAIFVLFILQLLRQGHYFYNGFLFFVWLYYFAYQMHNNPEFISKGIDHNEKNYRSFRGKSG